MTFKEEFISILAKRIGALLTELSLHPGDAKPMARAAWEARRRTPGKGKS